MCERQRSIVLLVGILLLIATGLAHASDAGLVGWWRFDEGAGTLAADSSGSGNDGTVVGGDWVAPGWDEKGYCLEFLYADDESDLIDLGTMNVVGEGITITGWINPYSFTQNDARVISKSSTGATADGHWWMLSTLNGVNVRFRLKTNENDTTLTLIDTAGLLVTGEWQFVTAGWDGTTASTYVNTVETGSAAKGGTAVATDASVPVAIGNQPATAGDGPRAWDGLIDDVRVYNRALTMEELAEVMLGGGPGANTELASAPVPGDEQGDVARDTLLSWAAGELAGTHDVYFGAMAADVDGADRANPLGVLVSEGQSATTYELPAALEYGQTYYWRVDEVNATADHAIFKGDIWSFTVEPFAYPIENIVATTNASSEPGSGPENTVNGSGLNASDEHSIAATDMWLTTLTEAEPIYIQYEFDGVYKLHEMWVWNYNVQFELVLGFGLKDVTVEYSADGVEWTVLGEVEFAQATASASYMTNITVDLQGVAARYVRLMVNSGWGMLGQYGLSEVRFLYIPVQPREPQPAAGVTDVSPTAVLAWRAGREAAFHEVHMGTDPEALELVGTVSEATLTPGDLLFGQTYYWKVSEVNEAEAITTWDGPVWSFMTQEYATIDDMESYNDDDNTIFDTWLDGWVNETGSTVGYLEAPFAERSIVHGGRQSMPLAYDNSAAPFYSEAEYDLGSMDLTANGADTLRLFVAGQADNSVAPVYVRLVDASGNTSVVAHPDTNVTTVSNWTEWRIAYSELNGVDLSRAASIAIGVGNRDNPTAGETGIVFIDDIGFGKPAPGQ